MGYLRENHMNMKQQELPTATTFLPAARWTKGVYLAASFAVAALGMVSFPVIAGPSSSVAWDSATRHLVANGDAVVGKTKASLCSSCHGTEGIAASFSYPNLAGQLAAYTYKQLKDYKALNRGKGSGMGMMMVSLVQAMSDKEMADIAAYYASLPLKQPEGSVLSKPVLVRKGDSKRIIPACQACHGSDGKGRKVNVASLAGQNPGYLAETLKQYRSGSRGNDVYSRMRLISKYLSDQEIQELSDYYASLK